MKFSLKQFSSMNFRVYLKCKGTGLEEMKMQATPEPSTMERSR